MRGRFEKMLGQNRGAGVEGKLASKAVNRVGCREARTVFRHRCRCGGPLRGRGARVRLRLGVQGGGSTGELPSPKCNSFEAERPRVATSRLTTAVPGNWPLRFLGLRLVYGSFLFLINT